MARWSEQEWESVCLELYRAQPLLIMTSKDMRDITKEHMITAMKTALPEDRWHLSMNMTLVRPRLKDTIDNLRESLKKIEHDQQEEQRQAAENERRHQKARARVDVYAPMMEAVAEALFHHMRPMMECYVEARLTGTPSAIAVDRALNIHKEARAPRKLRIGVIGLLPIQEEEIKKRFPQLEVVPLDKDRSWKTIVTQVRGLDQVFALIHKMDHHAVEKEDNCTRVPGKGVSSMIHSIEVWLIANAEK